MPTFCLSRSANFPVTAVLAFFCAVVCCVGTSCVCHIGKRICPPDLANDDVVSVCVGAPLNCIDSLHAFREVDEVCLPLLCRQPGI